MGFSVWGLGRRKEEEEEEEDEEEEEEEEMFTCTIGGFRIMTKSMPLHNSSILNSKTLFYFLRPLNYRILG